MSKEIDNEIDDIYMLIEICEKNNELIKPEWLRGKLDRIKSKLEGSE